MSKPKIITYKYQRKEYPVIMQTADAVVFCYDRGTDRDTLNVLMIRRKDNKKLALPGGYVNYYESTHRAAIRECKEETGYNLFDVPCRGYQLHDNPARSKVGNRRITVAYVYSLFERKPRVKAGDDADWAGWMPYKLLKNHEKYNNIHDDHMLIIDKAFELL